MGRDPLGLQATSIRMYQGLVPGITNITNRLRYYSYFPWIIRLYEKAEHSTSSSKWATFVRRADALFALSSMVADPAQADGLGGWDWANNQRQRAAEHGIDLARYTDDPNSSERYLLASRGTFGGAYAPTFIDFGLISDSQVPVTLGRGTELAKAFGASIGSAAELIRDTLTRGHVEAKALLQIGEAVHPAHIPEPSEELRLLRDFLFGTWGDAQAEARRSTAWLLLDAYRRGVTAGNSDQLRQLWYDRLLPDGSAYSQLGLTIDRWRAYQANEYCHLALECMLNGLVGLQAQSYRDGIEPRRLIAEVVSDGLADEGGSWSDWALSVADDSNETEAVLGARVLDALQMAKRPDAALVRDSFALLARLWVRWAAGDGDVRKIIMTAAGRNGRSLDGVMRTLDDRADQPLREVASTLLQRHIIIDHQTIAGHKLASAGTFTYHFMVADGLLTDGKVGDYAYTTPRLGNFTRLLRDAKLIDGNGVTADGEAFVEQNQPL